MLAVGVFGSHPHPRDERERSIDFFLQACGLFNSSKGQQQLEGGGGGWNELVRRVDGSFCTPDERYLCSRIQDITIPAQPRAIQPRAEGTEHLYGSHCGAAPALLCCRPRCWIDDSPRLCLGHSTIHLASGDTSDSSQERCRHAFFSGHRPCGHVLHNRLGCERTLVLGFALRPAIVVVNIPSPLSSRHLLFHPDRLAARHWGLRGDVRLLLRGICPLQPIRECEHFVVLYLFRRRRKRHLPTIHNCHVTHGCTRVAAVRERGGSCVVCIEHRTNRPE